MSLALKLHDEMVNGINKLGVICKPNIVTYGSIIDGLCKDDYVDKAKDLFLEMRSKGIHPNVVVYNCLVTVFVVLVIGTKPKLCLVR